MIDKIQKFKIYYCCCSNFNYFYYYAI